MVGRARRHHLVSKFYLRHFADQSGLVATVELPGHRTFTQSVEDASVRRDYYTAVDNEGEETDSAETAFAKIEGPAAKSWRNVTGGTWPLTPTDRGNMAAWIALQLLRADSVRTSMEQIGSDVVQLEIMMGGRDRLRENLRDQGRPFNDLAVNAEWVSLFIDPPKVDVQANHHLQHVVELLPRVMLGLLGRWWLLTRFDRRTLATSDNPVVLIPNDRDTQLGLGTGIDTADQILVPLTRRLCLSLATRDSLAPDLAHAVDLVQPGSTQVALYANSATSRNARRFLFHHPQDTPLAGLELPDRREREIGQSGDPWRFMRIDDRQVLIDAGLEPPTTLDDT